VCVELDIVDHEYPPYFHPKDSGAPIISNFGKEFFEVKGILSDLKDDNGMNPGVFAYVDHPDNFEFIKKNLKKVTHRFE